MRTIVGLAAALAASLLLSGCTSGVAAPKGPSQTDIASFSNALFLLREVAGVSSLDLERPDVAPTPYLSFGDGRWERAMASCLTTSGAAEYALGKAGSLKWTTKGYDDSAGRRLTWYSCGSQNAADPTTYGILSPAQREFVYRYYASWLVPCIELNGYSIVSPPTREQFVNDPLQSGWWNPYYSLSKPLTKSEIGRLMAACPPTPNGIPIAGNP